MSGLLKVMIAIVPLVALVTLQLDVNAADSLGREERIRASKNITSFITGFHNGFG